MYYYTMILLILKFFMCNIALHLCACPILAQHDEVVITALNPVQVERSALIGSPLAFALIAFMRCFLWDCTVLISMQFPANPHMKCRLMSPPHLCYYLFGKRKLRGRVSVDEKTKPTCSPTT